MHERRFIPAPLLQTYALYQIPHHAYFAIECLSCGVVRRHRRPHHDDRQRNQADDQPGEGHHPPRQDGSPDFRQPWFHCRRHVHLLFGDDRAAAAQVATDRLEPAHQLRCMAHDRSNGQDARQREDRVNKPIRHHVLSPVQLPAMIFAFFSPHKVQRKRGDSSFRLL